MLTGEELERRREAEGVMDVQDIAKTVQFMASLPLDANVLELTVVPTKQPLVGRG
jgi:NADP-dependent 3-hydroxy acid dehydrogenase YdfG